MSQFGAYDTHPIIAEYYSEIQDAVVGPGVAFYLALARSVSGPILELGCGSGRILLRLAEAGQTVIGLDSSQALLARCQAKLQRYPQDVQQRVSLIHGDLTCFAVRKQMAAIVLPFRPLHHVVRVDEHVQCFQCINQHLPVGGQVAFDVYHTAPGTLVQAAPTPEKEMGTYALADGRRLRHAYRTVAYHRAEQYNEIEVIYELTYPDGHGERVVQQYPQRYFFRYEVEHLLARCGFRVVAVFGSFERTPLENQSPEMVFIAEKAVSCD